MSFGNNGRPLANLLKFTIFTLLVFTFTLALPLSATSADSDQALFFKDDFSNPDSGWPTEQRGYGSLKYANGGYVISIDRTGLHNYTHNKNITTLQDLIVAVDVIMEVGGAEDYSELIAGWVVTKPESISLQEDRPDNYYFRIFSVGETAEIYSWEQAVWGNVNKAAAFLLPRTRYSAINTGKQNNNLRFVFKGNKLKAYINNKQMLEATDENILFANRLKDLGFVEGKYIYLGAGKGSRLEKAIVKFDNFKLYRGTQKAFLFPEELKDSNLLKERIKAAEEYGFDIGLIEYYGKTTDCSQSISKLTAAKPVAIQVICKPGEKSNMIVSLVEYTGEVIYEEISLKDFALGEITFVNSRVKKGEELKISVTAKNTGYLPIKQLSCNYTAYNCIGNILFSGKTEILDLPVGKDRIVEIVQGIPLSSADGDCKLKVVLSNSDIGNGGQAITREKESAFTIAGLSSSIITGISIFVIVLLGIAVAVIFMIKKKQKKKASV